MPTNEIRTLVLGLLDHWRLRSREDILNLLSVEVPPKSDAAKVLRVTGVVHLALAEFEEDVLAAYPGWVLIVDGSYTLHRILEYARGLSPFGVFKRPIAAAQPGETLLREGGAGIPQGSRFVVHSQRRKDETAIVFHSSLRLVGVDAVSEFISIAVGLESRRILPSGEDFAQLEPVSIAKGPSERAVDDAFRLSIKGLDPAIRRIVRDYEGMRSEMTKRSLTEIHKALRQERSQLQRRFTGDRLAHKIGETSEFWQNREFALIAAAKPERVEVVLAAVTVEYRIITEYEGKLELPGRFVRPSVRVFDHSCGAFALGWCDVCGSAGTVLTVGLDPCEHLMCDWCRSELTTCEHLACQLCRPECGVCGQQICARCEALCDACKAPVCKSHLQRCQRCGQSKCSPCLNLQCPVCVKDICGETRCPVCRKATCGDHIDHSPRCYRRWWNARLEELVERFERSEPATAMMPANWLAPFHLKDPDRPLTEQILANVIFPTSDGPYPQLSGTADRWLSRRSGRL